MDKKAKKSLFAVYFILFLDNFGFAVVFPLFPILFLHPAQTFITAHVSEPTRNLLLGIVLMSFPAAQFFGAPFFGDIADRFGRKIAFFFTILGTIIGYSLSAISIHLELFSLLLISRLITGFFAGNLSLAMAVVADLTPDEKARGKRMGLVTAFLGLSWILAILVGSLFSNRDYHGLFHPPLPMWITAIVSVISLLVLIRFYTETRPISSGHKVSLLKGVHQILAVLEIKRLRLLYGVLFLWFLGFVMSLQWVAPLSLEKYGVGQTQIMWMFTIMGVIWSLSSGLFNRFLITRFSMWNITILALFITACFYFLLGVSTSFYYFAGFYVLSAISASITWGDSVSLISIAAKENEQGKAMGIAQSVTALAQSIGPLLGGLIIQISKESLFYLSFAVVLMSFLILVIYKFRDTSAKNK